METLLPLLIGGGGIGALIFGALKFRGEEATQLTAQTQSLIESMQSVINELEEALERCRKDRDRYRERIRDIDERREDDRDPEQRWRAT